MRAGNTTPIPTDHGALHEGLLSLSRELHCAVDGEGRLHYVNAAFAEHTGQAPDALQATPFVDCLPEADRPLAARRLREAGKGQREVTWEAGTAGDGARAVAWRARLEPQSGLVLAVGRDVSEARRLSAELDASQRLQRALFETIPHGVVVKDRDGNYLAGNAAWSRRYGCEPEELIGRNVMDVETRPEAERRHAIELDRLVIEGDQPHYEFELARTLPSGETRHHHSWRSKLRDESGAVIGQVGIIEDITERRQADMALRASEARFRSLVEGSIEGIVILRMRKPLFANQSYAHIFGYAHPDEIVALDSVDQLIAPHERERVQTYARDRLSGRPAPNKYEFEGLRRDGSRVWLDCHTIVVDWEGAPAIQVTLFDISERKRAEMALRSHQRLLSTIFDTLPHLVFVKDGKGRYLMANAAWLQHHASAEDVLPGLATMAMTHRPLADREDALRLDRQVLSTGQPLEVEYERTGADGKRRVYRNHRAPLRDDEGHLIGVLGISEDITQHKRAEEELRASQRLLRLVMDTIPHIVFVKDTAGRYALVNRTMAEFHGMAQADMVGRRVGELVGGPVAQEAQRLAEMDRQVLEQGLSVESPDVYVFGANGRRMIHHVRKLPLHDDAGRIEGLVCITEDVTERRRAEEELRASQRLLRLVLDALPHIVVVKDLEGRYVLVNRAMCEFHGVGPAQMLGRRVGELPGPQPAETQRLREMDREVLATGQRSVWSDATVTAADGHVVTQHIHKLPLRDDADRLIGVVAVSEDITERRRAEEELRASQRLLRSVVDLLPHNIYVKDLDGRYLFVNQAIAQFHALTPEQMVGRRAAELAGLTAEQVAMVEETDRETKEAGHMLEWPEVAISNAANQPTLRRMCKVPLRDGEGRIRGIVGISEDITERKRSEQAVQQAQKLESLGVLAGGIAHDFNNLLVSVLGYAHLATLELPQGSPVQPLVNQIETAGRRASELCNQMLAYAGKGSFQVSRVGLNGLIREMTDLMRVSLSRNVRLHFDFASALPDVEADATQLRQVVMNLVINAAEAIGEETGAITLRTGAVRADSALLAGFVADPPLLPGAYVLLEVSDTGCGMDAGTVQRIFDPFFTTKFSGRGLGLAAVLGIVRGHRGGLRVTSQPGRGTTFGMLLPRAQPAHAPAPSETPAARVRGSGTVLVVDDETAIRELAVLVLEHEGYTVACAADGAEAVQVARGLGAALRAILLDVTMPGISTEETLQRLAAAGVQVPVVVMSGHAETELRQRFAGLPVAALLPKPFTGDAIQAKLEQVLAPADA